MVSYMVNATPAGPHMGVLILVVVEDGLVLGYTDCISSEFIVLILVVVEDGLVPVGRVPTDYN